MRKDKKIIVKQRMSFLSDVAEISDKTRDIVGKTMTWAGDYVTLPNGITTNDGATIIENLVNADFGENEAQRTYVRKLEEATAKTDELAGDGTSATVVLTSALVNELLERFVNWGRRANQIQIINSLNWLEKDIIKFLYENKISLKTKEDYIKLAKVSTKDNELGELIGTAFYDGGENAIISRRPAKEAKDSVDIESNFIVPTTINGLNIPTTMENVETITINSTIARQTKFLEDITKYTFNNNKNVLIICEEIGEIALKYIQAVNEVNKGKGTLTIMSVPNDNAHEWYEDINAYVGGQTYAQEAFELSFDSSKIKFGKLDTFVSRNDGIILANKELSETAMDKIVELNKEIKSLNETVNGEKIRNIKERVNQLKGKTIWLNIYAQNQSQLQTKLLRIEDAIKATQFTLGFGYIPGAGTFYEAYLKNLRETYTIAEINEKTMNIERALESIPRTIDQIATSFPNHSNTWETKKETLEQETLELLENSLKGEESEKRIVYEGWIIDKDGWQAYRGDVIDAGIIDSAKSFENIIKNSFAIAKEIASVGHFIEEVDAEEYKEMMEKYAPKTTGYVPSDFETRAETEIYNLKSQVYDLPSMRMDLVNKANISDLNTLQSTTLATTSVVNNINDRLADIDGRMLSMENTLRDELPAFEPRFEREMEHYTRYGYNLPRPAKFKVKEGK